MMLHFSQGQIPLIQLRIDLISDWISVSVRTDPLVRTHYWAVQSSINSKGGSRVFTSLPISVRHILAFLLCSQSHNTAGSSAQSLNLCHLWRTNICLKEKSGKCWAHFFAVPLSQDFRPLSPGCLGSPTLQFLFPQIPQNGESCTASEYHCLHLFSISVACANLQMS